MTTPIIITAILAFVALAYFGKGYLGLVAATILGFAAWREAGVADVEAFRQCLYIAIGVLVVFGLPFIRRILSILIMKAMAKALPPIGETEDIALKAGTVWWEGDIFSGNPKWNKLLKYSKQRLTKEEKAFLDGPTEELCAMLDEEEICQKRDLPPKVWKFIKDNKFLGMVISKEHGGLGFGAYAHAAVITKIATRSNTAAVMVMVPNSLGPGELLHHYGTKEQKDHYLPRLAVGKEIPCFGLTEPHAGSDAANGRSIGIVTKKKVGGKEVLGISLTFNKRYITLAPIATVVGLAFNLKDPEGLLGGAEDIGITCALLPSDTEGLEIGERHDPMGIPFPNGPLRGKDVFIPMDYVIGGQEYVGHGWRMLMECLSVGRSISLPSLAVGGSQLSARVTSAYATIREQFGLQIGKFEGVREGMANIFSTAYSASAARDLTSAAIDDGAKPAVASAILKRYLTEHMRKAMNDAMDIQAGASICRGPRNIFSRAYDAIPIGITVEGANILTRSLMVFGQGAMRCHPFLLKEVNAIMDNDLKAFDKAFFGHINHVVRNAIRALVHGLTFGRLTCVPCKGKLTKHYRRLSRLSAAFAFAADMGLLTLGGALKRKEYLSGRYADALAYLYIGSLTLKRHHDEGNKKEDVALVDYALTEMEHFIEDALFGVIDNLPNRAAAWKIRLIAFPFGRCYKKPTDKQRDAIVEAVVHPDNGVRDRLTPDVFVPKKNIPGLGALEAAYAHAINAMDARKKLDKARRKGLVKKGSVKDMAKEAHQSQVIGEEEYAFLVAADESVDDIVQVDYFDPKDYAKRR